MPSSTACQDISHCGFILHCPVLGWAQLGKWVLLSWNATPGADTPLGKFRSSPSLGQPAVPVETPAHGAWFHSWYQQPSQRHLGTMNSRWGRAQKLTAPSQNIISPWLIRVWRWDTTQGTTSMWQLQASTKLCHIRARENNVCVLLFGITRLALQGEELCEHVSNSFMQPKVSISKLFNRQNCALNSQQIKVISFSEIPKNSKCAKSIWLYIYSE